MVTYRFLTAEWPKTGYELYLLIILLAAIVLGIHTSWTSRGKLRTFLRLGFACDRLSFGILAAWGFRVVKTLATLVNPWELCRGKCC